MLTQVDQSYKPLERAHSSLRSTVAYIQQGKLDRLNFEASKAPKGFLPEASSFRMIIHDEPPSNYSNMLEARRFESQTVSPEASKFNMFFYPSEEDRED